MTQLDAQALRPSVAASRGRRRALLRELRRSDRPVRALSFVIALAGCLAVVMPLLWMLSTSLKSPAEVLVFPPIWIPRPLRWNNYLTALTSTGMPFGRYFANTALITWLCLVGDVLSSSLVGFGFARLRVPHKNLIFAFVLATMMLPYQVTMIPQYLLFRYLGWLDSYKPLIVPTFFGSAYLIFLQRQFYMGIPREMDDAAKIDGAGYFRIWFSICMPMSRPVMAAVAIISFMFHWNDFLAPLIYINTFEKYTVAIGLANFQAMYGATPWHLLMAASLVAIAPCALIFFFAQRYFIQGVVITGVKG